MFDEKAFILFIILTQIHIFSFNFLDCSKCMKLEKKACKTIPSLNVLELFFFCFNTNSNAYL